MIFESIAKMAIMGASTAGGLMLFGNIQRGSSVEILGQRIPIWAVGAVGGAVASGVSDAIHPLIQENININKKFEHNASLLMGALISGATLTGLLFAVNQDFLRVTGMTRMFLIGSGSEIAGAFVASIVDIE